jgi:hypothetical protein
LITLNQFWMGRDKTHAAELTDAIRANAQETMDRINDLLTYTSSDGVDVGIVASGWRPTAINADTPNAAPNSKHMTGEACDVKDDEHRSFARWCLRNTTPLCHQEGKPDLLQQIGLWMEQAQWTPTWVHLQIVPPHSGRRIFVPSENPPLAAALPEQERALALA